MHMGPHCNAQPQRCNYLVRIGVLEKEEQSMGLFMVCVCLWTVKYGPLGEELLCPACRNRIIEVVAVRVPWNHQNIIFATPSSPWSAIWWRLSLLLCSLIVTTTIIMGPAIITTPFCGLLCKVNSIITRWSMEEEDNHIDDPAGGKEYYCPIPNCLAIVQLCLLFPFVIVVSGGNNSPTEWWLLNNRLNWVLKGVPITYGSYNNLIWSGFLIGIVIFLTLCGILLSSYSGSSSQ